MLSTVSTRMLLCLVLVCALTGCANFSLPRIDPTGERLFLPCGTPPAPAVPGAPAPAIAGQWGISVSPSQVIAPVGSEVIMIASVAGPNGFLLTRERVEWMLAPESVGQIVSPGQRRWYEVLNWMHGLPKKVDNRYAVNSTQWGPRLIDRGTPTPSDDVLIQSGQAWVSVTSPIEGNSHVTVFAPGIAGWDRRQQTATIYWVDAQWRFPSPAITPVGSRHALITTVTRQTDNAPLAGWMVRYDIVGGPEAGFAPDGAASVEVATGPNGEAVAELFQKQAVAGNNQVNIQVIRPAGIGGQTRPLPLGAGGVIHTWSTTATGGEAAPPIGSPAPPVEQPAPPAEQPAPPAAEPPSSTPAPVPPELEVHVSGPETAQVGGTVHFDIEVHNRGGGPATGLLISDRFDSGLEHEKATGTIEKDLADLPPGAIARLAVDFRVTQAGELCQNIQVTASGGASATAQKCIRATEPEPAGGVTAPPAAEPPAEQPPAEQPGPETPPTNAEPPAGEPSTAPDTKLGRLTIKKTGPQQRRVGETALFTIEIANIGSDAIEELEIADNFETSLQPVRATEGSTMLKGNTLGWQIDRLEPGRSLRRAVEFNCLRETPRACNRVTVTAKDIEPIADEACMEILAPEAAPPAETDTPAPAADSAAPLTLTVADTADPINVKGETSYQIIITNKTEQSLFDVELTVTYSGELTIETFNGPVRATVTPGTLRFLAVREFRAGESPLTFELRAVGTKPGAARIQASVTSRGQSQPITAEQTTEVLAPGGQ